MNLTCLRQRLLMHIKKLAFVRNGLLLTFRAAAGTSALPRIATELVRRGERRKGPLASFCAAGERRGFSAREHRNVIYKPAD
jgi:hypothetical protein